MENKQKKLLKIYELSQNPKLIEIFDNWYENRKKGFKKLVRQVDGIRVFRLNSPCIVCKNNMRIAPGQIAYFHGACRTEGRRIIKKNRIWKRKQK